MKWRNILRSIAKGKKFLITTHVHPDPDALCSQLAISMYLKKAEKRVVMINDDCLAERFLFLPGANMIKSAGRVKKFSYDAAIIVDCGDFNRIGSVKKYIRKDKPIINIDHHITNDGFGDMNLVEPHASSTSEVIYGFLRRVKFNITKDIAMLLYLGIMTDTGSFRYDNTSAYTHRIVSELLKFDFSVNKLYQRMYETIPFKELKYFTEIISDFEMLYAGKVVCVQLPKKTIQRFSEDFDLKDKIFRHLRAIKGVEVIVILTEQSKSQTRVNLRSQAKVDVAQIAFTFSGGGHKKASGCYINSDMKTAKKEILKEIRKVL